jgi:hypothetical protein
MVVGEGALPPELHSNFIPSSHVLSYAENRLGRPCFQVFSASRRTSPVLSVAEKELKRRWSEAEKELITSSQE